MNKNVYEDYMTQNHINVLSIEELCSETKDVSKFFGYSSLSLMDEVSQSFKKVYTLFDKSRENLLDCHARNAYEEAALHDLRYAMEKLFYQIREDYPGNDMFEHGALCDAAKLLISIFIVLPNIMYEKAKENIFNCIIKYNLLKK